MDHRFSSFLRSGEPTRAPTRVEPETESCPGVRVLTPSFVTSFRLARLLRLVGMPPLRGGPNLSRYAKGAVVCLAAFFESFG